MNPFVGPTPFGANDTIYGRDEEVSELRYFVGAKRIVLLHAPSGAGKSSLLQAKNGLLARLRASGRFDVWGPARVNSAPDALTVANRFAWSAIVDFEKSRAEGARAPATFVSTTLCDYVRQRTTTASPLLVFDQFEEVLRLDPADVAAKHAFFDQLGELLYDPHVWAIFVLREDYLAALQPYARQIPTYLQHRFRIDFLNREPQALDAVTRPLAALGRHFAPDVAESMLKDLATAKSQSGEVVGDVVEPLQIQVVCTNLWERIRGADPATPIVASDIGNVGDALGAYYEKGVKRADVGLERQIRTFFDEALVTNGIRNLVRSEPNVTAGLANAEIDTLCDVYLIRKELRAGGYWLELSHDRLLEPVRSSNERWFADSKNVQKFQKYATQWRREDRPDSLLLLGRDLDEANAWASSHADRLSKPEPEQGFPDGIDRAFLAASEKKQRAADREARQARNLSRWLRLAVVAAIAAVGFGAYALSAARRAATAEATARTSESAARTALGAAAVQEGTRLAALGAEHDALAYFARALRADPNSKAAVTWITSLALNRDWTFVSPLEHADSAVVVAASDDGSRLLTGCCFNQAELQVWNTKTHEKVGPPMTFTNLKAGETPDEFYISGNGKRLAVVNDGILDTWDVDRGEYLVRGLKEADSSIHSAALSPDGALLATGASNGVLRVRDAATGQEIGRPLTGIVGLDSVAFSPNGRQIMAGYSRGVRIWTVDGRGDALTVVQSIQTNPIRSAFFTPDGREVVLLEDGAVKLWDIATNSVRAEFQAPQVHVIVASPDGRRALTSSNGALQIWNVETGQPIGAPIPGDDQGAKFSRDGKRLVVRASGRKGEGALWDADTGAAIGGAFGTDYDIESFELSPDGRTVITSTWETYVRMWTPSAAKEQWTFRAGPAVASMVFTADRRRALAYGSGHFYLLDTEVGRTLAECHLDEKVRTSGAAFTPDGPRAFLLDEDGAQIWDTEHCRRVGPSIPHPHINFAAFSSDGRRAITTSYDETKLWTLSPRPALERATSTGGHSAIFSPDDRLVAIEPSREVRVWDTQTGVLGVPIREAVLFGNASLVAVAFSPDSRHLLVASDVAADIRDPFTAKSVGVRLLHRDDIIAATFSPDRRTLLTIDRKAAHVWDAATGAPIGGRMTLDDKAEVAQFSPDGTLVAIAADKVAQLWSVATGTRASAKLDADDEILGLAFSADSRSLIALLSNGTLRAWPVVADCCSTQDEANRLATLAESLGGTQVTDSGAIRVIDGLKRQWVLSDSVLAKTPRRWSVDWLIRRFSPAPN
jgi:WD40 repeat protein